MTPDQEFDLLVDILRRWPDRLPTDAVDDELRLHLAASKEVLQSPVLLAAARQLCVHHFLAPLIRPAAAMLTHAIDAQMQKAIQA